MKVKSESGKKVKVRSFSRARLIVTPWTVAYQAPPSMGFPGQEYWSGLPLPSPLHEYTFTQKYVIYNILLCGTI